MESEQTPFNCSCRQEAVNISNLPECNIFSNSNQVCNDNLEAYINISEQTPSNCSCSSSVLLNMTSLYMDRVSLPMVGVVGLAGNVAAIVIICRKDRRSTFHHSLITLALIDILFVREG